jgi:hypothetical protein
VLEAARALVDRVEAHAAADAGDKPRIELLGELSAMLRRALRLAAQGPPITVSQAATCRPKIL